MSAARFDVFRNDHWWAFWSPVRWGWNATVDLPAGPARFGAQVIDRENRVVEVTAEGGTAGIYGWARTRREAQRRARDAARRLLLSEWAR